MRLLFAIKSLNVAGGGAERVLVDVANGMKVRGHDVQILTFDRPGQSFYNLNPSIARLDTGIGRPGEPTPRAGFIKALPRVRKMIMNARADLVIAFMHSTYVPLSMALLGSGARLLVSEHIDATHYRSRPLQRALVWLADRLALAKTVPSPPIREQHPAAFRHRVHVMPNPVDMAQFIGGTYQACIQPPVILSVGRFMQQKNHMELLQAFARLADRFPEWTLKLVGNGLLRPELEAEVDRLGLSNRVYLPGVSRHVADEYAAASIVALPSRYESFGLVAVEALASGRPLLAFDNCVGIAEMVESGVNGLLVSANGDRVAHLAQGLEKLMMDEGLRKRLGAAGPNSVRHFDLDRVLDAWESLFLELNVTEGSN